MSKRSRSYSDSKPQKKRKTDDQKDESQDTGSSSEELKKQPQQPRAQPQSQPQKEHLKKLTKEKEEDSEDDERSDKKRSDEEDSKKSDEDGRGESYRDRERSFDDEDDDDENEDYDQGGLAGFGGAPAPNAAENPFTKFFSAFEPNKASAEATRAIHKAFEEVMAMKPTDGISASPVNDNMYKWHVKLFGFDKDTQIFQDLFLYESVHPNRDHVLVEVIFSSMFPHYPPFMRVVYPRFHQYTGHITIGGSICVKELTANGWSSTFSLSSFFIMIRNLLIEGGALIDMDNAQYDYTDSEARDAFLRVARQHGWL